MRNTRKENMKTWKCYRCNLTFQNELHVDIHRDITKHSVSIVQVTIA